jgi:hypothetical protein
MELRLHWQKKPEKTTLPAIRHLLRRTAMGHSQTVTTRRRKAKAKKELARVTKEVKKVTNRAGKAAGAKDAKKGAAAAP